MVSEAVTTGRLPLKGLRVAEFAHFVAGPAAGLLLADLGASVIKVERLEGDSSRQIGVSEAVYRAWNSNKRSIALDLKSPAGRQVALDLALSSDIILESFRPGVMEKLGLGYAEISARRPDIIYASVSGFGQSGAQSNRAGVDSVVQAESGIMQTTGIPGGDPLRIGFELVDTATGMALSNAILAALLMRKESNAGSRIDIALYNVALYLQAHNFTMFSLTGKEPERAGNGVTYAYPADLMRTADGAIQLAAASGSHWNALCDLLGIPEIAMDDRFNTGEKRVKNRNELHSILETIFLRERTEHWMAVLLKRGLNVGEVRSYRSVLNEGSSDERDRFAYLRDATGESYVVVRPPYTYTGLDTVERQPAPTLGGDSRDVLQSLGYGAAEIAGLVSARVVAGCQSEGEG